LDLDPRSNLIIYLDSAGHLNGHSEAKWNGLIDWRALITLSLYL
jgi:hypothetical protein